MIVIIYIQTMNIYIEILLTVSDHYYRIYIHIHIHIGRDEYVLITSKFLLLL